MHHLKFGFTLLILLLPLLTLTNQQSHPLQDQNTQKSATDVIFQTQVIGSNSGRQSIFPISTREAYGFVLMMFFAGLANAGGLGGGTSLTLLLIVVFNYTESHAIQMVYALIFGGSLGNFLNVVSRKDPKTNKPLVDYNLGLICMPLMLFGATLGVIANRIAAPVFTLVGLFGVTLYSMARMYSKAIKQYKEETRQKRLAALEDKENTEENIKENLISVNDTSSTNISDESLDSIVEEDQRLFPKRKIGIILALILVIISLSVLRGTKNLPSVVGITYCGLAYWGVDIATMIVCIVVLVFNINTLKMKLKTKKLRNIVTKEGKFELSEDHIPKLIVLSLIAGILAGFLGIGGGIVMGPTLISMGLPAQSLAATSGFFIVQTSFISLVQSCLYADLPLVDQGIFLTIAIVGSYMVSYCLSWLVKKFQRPSLILFTLLIVLSMSLITTPVFEILTNLGHLNMLFLFNPLC